MPNRPVPDIHVSVDVRRPPEVVRRWWLDLPDVYVATDPKEQPHRIETLERSGTRRVLLTYWRGPLGRELKIREDLIEHDDGNWSFEIELPFGLAQRDDFTLTPTPEGTRVDIAVRIWARASAGALARPLLLRYARKQYPRTWRYAAKACERATGLG